MADATAIESFIKDTESLARSIKVYLEGSDSIIDALEQDKLNEDTLAAIRLDPDAVDEPAERFVSDKIDTVPLPELRAAAAEDAAQPFLAYLRDTIVERENASGAEAIDALERITLTMRDESNLALMAQTIEDRWRTVDDALSTVFDPEGAHQQAKIGAFSALALKAYARAETLDFDNTFAKMKNQRRYLSRYLLPAWRRASVIGHNPAAIFTTSGSHMPPPTHASESYGNGPTDDCCNRIVDAISRLQEGGAGGLGSSGSTGLSAPSGDFGKALDQQIYTTLGLPSMISDTSMNTDPAKLVDKLVSGLDRAVLSVEKGEATEYVFSPAQARAVAPLDGGYAVGAQGVVAEAIAAHKPTILRYVNLLVPESCHCSEEEVDDIKEDIERSLDLLIAEARTSVGVFSAWTGTLIHRLLLDITALIDLYGIQYETETATFEFISEFLKKYIGVATGTSLEGEGRTFDRDVGFLTREANDQAIQGIFTEIKLISEYIDGLGTLNRGPILVRLRAVVDALPPSVVNARSALNLAGVGEVDQSAFFVAIDDTFTGSRVIDLARLLSWVEACANEWRSRLLEENLNSRDLSWLEDTLNVQDDALSNLISVVSTGSSPPELATINASQFALGVRQLREVEKHLKLALELVCKLRQLITDRALPVANADRNIPA